MNEHDETDMPYGREGEPWGKGERAAKVSGHTPGPWKSSPLGVVTGGQFSCTSIATVPTKSWCLNIFAAVQDQKPQELVDWLNGALAESKANAALIAAAPELLEALTACLVKLDAMAEKFGERWPIDLSPKRAETLARAAIRKAEGND